VSNSSTSNATELGNQFNVPVVVHQERDSTKLFAEISNTLQEFHIDLLIYAGFMKISPSWFVQRFPGINLHPADLTQVREDGTPKYTGMRAVQDAIADHVSSVSSTLHVVDTQADHGTPIAVSKPLELSGTGMENSSEVHERMKIHCEHIAYPHMLELLSKGEIIREKLPIRL
jgi:phosphoribosylglycinamide formyltransferase-1